MTAREAKKALIQTLYECYIEQKTEAYINLDNAWKTFEEQLCKEQREMCSKSLGFTQSLTEKMDAILNTKMPDL